MNNIVILFFICLQFFVCVFLLFIYYTDNAVAIGYSQLKGELIIVSAFNKGMPVLSIDPTVIIYENDYDNQTQHVSTDKLISDEVTIVTNRQIETALISKEYPIKLFVKPYYYGTHGYIVYQHGTCGHVWFINNLYQLCLHFYSIFLFLFQNTTTRENCTFFCVNLIKLL